VKSSTFKEQLTFYDLLRISTTSFCCVARIETSSKSTAGLLAQLKTPKCNQRMLGSWNS